jgi:hypothetical protein
MRCFFMMRAPCARVNREAFYNCRFAAAAACLVSGAAIRLYRADQRQRHLRASTSQRPLTARRSTQRDIARAPMSRPGCSKLDVRPHEVHQEIDKLTNPR